MARYRTFIRSAMRRAWMKWPPKYQCLHAARRPYVGPNKKQKWEAQCAHCKKWHMLKDVAVDHIIPWGSIVGLSIDEAWSRLLVGIDGLQVLCDPCHTIKTNGENDGTRGLQSTG
jgi:5-methylcytosine-specific restriction endonuclease McrA